MASLFRSLIVKKYSLKPVKYQIAIQSLLIGFVCLFGVLPVSINDTVVQLSIKQALVFASMLSVSIGCVNAFVELQSHETKLVYLVSGKRILSSIRILFVELCDVVLQSTLYFIVLLIWFHFFSSENGVSLEIISFYFHLPFGYVFVSIDKEFVGIEMYPPCLNQVKCSWRKSVESNTSFYRISNNLGNFKSIKKNYFKG